MYTEGRDEVPTNFCKLESGEIVPYDFASLREHPDYKNVELIGRGTVYSVRGTVQREGPWTQTFYFFRKVK